MKHNFQFVLYGKKRSWNRTSNYLITLNEKNLDVKAAGYAAKLRSNFLGTEFKIYDSGLNPKNKGANNMSIRRELGAVYYVNF